MGMHDAKICVEVKHGINVCFYFYFHTMMDGYTAPLSLPGKQDLGHSIR